MKFHTKFRPGDLVKDKKTGDEGVIVEAQAHWRDKTGQLIMRTGSELKQRNETYEEAMYGIHQKTRYSSLNGWWFHDDQLELVKKGYLH